MPIPVWHDLGAVDGGCTVCGVEGLLSLGEARFTPSLVERLRREPVPTPARLVTCSGCGWRWSVRLTDDSVEGVRARTAGAARQAARVTDEPIAAARTVLPQQRCSRDWAYSR